MTTKHSPHKILLGYCPSAAEELTLITNNETVEARHQLIKQHREVALQALNKIVQTAPESQYHVGDWVWLEAKHLALLYASAQLAPRCHGPFWITKEISLVAYQLELPRAWTIHNVFHSSLLTPYKETPEHRAQFQCPPPELIDNMRWKTLSITGTMGNNVSFNTSSTEEVTQQQMTHGNPLTKYTLMN